MGPGAGVSPASVSASAMIRCASRAGIPGRRAASAASVALTECPSLSPADGTVLRAGMMLTLEPCVELVPGRIMVHGENLLLREDGPVLLSARAPAELPEIAP